MKVAFASKDGIFVNEHFGWCEKFYIYELNEEGYKLINEADSLQKHEAEADKLEYKIECLDSSDIVCVSQIGPKAANMVKLAGIYPMRASNEDEKIEEVLVSLLKLLLDDPPLWLKRIVLR